MLGLLCWGLILFVCVCVYSFADITDLNSNKLTLMSSMYACQRIGFLHGNSVLLCNGVELVVSTVQSCGKRLLLVCVGGC